MATTTEVLKRFRKKPVVILAVQWDGTEVLAEQLSEIMGDVYAGANIDRGLIIKTLEGNMCARVGDWIIRGVNGEFYPCKPDIFEKTYDRES